MNILFITSLYPVTGDSGDITVTWSLHKLVKQWQNREGVEVRVVRPVYIYFSELLRLGGKIGGQTKPLLKKNIVIDGVPVIIFPIYKIPRLAYYYAPLYRYVDKSLRRSGFRPDMVIAHYDKSLHIGYEYSMKKNLPLVAGLHITLDLMLEDSREFNQRRGHILERATLIACRSRYIFNKIKQWFPGYQNKCMIAFSGVEAAHIVPPHDAVLRLKQWRQDKANNSETLCLVSVSSLIPRKNIDAVLRALAALDVPVPWTYTIIGDGDERLRLEALAEQLGIRKRVRFTGLLPRHRVTAELKQAHIFILISSLETFGLVYLEAMAAGLVTIGAKNEGIDGIIQHQKNGFLCPAGQSNTLTETLEHIITQMSTRELEDILTKSHQTITRYTEEQASNNYFQRLQESLIGSIGPIGPISPITENNQTP